MQLRLLRYDFKIFGILKKLTVQTKALENEIIVF